MIRPLIVLVFVLFAATTSAQTPERSLDLSALGWGVIEAEMVDTDANPYTEEWVVHGLDGFLSPYDAWRVVAVRPGGLCIGQWFDPKPAGTFATVTLQKTGRARLVMIETAYEGWTPKQRLTVIRLDTPRCAH